MTVVMGAVMDFPITRSEPVICEHCGAQMRWKSSVDRGAIAGRITRTLDIRCAGPEQHAQRYEDNGLTSKSGGDGYYYVERLLP
jgi:hypothetical protein